LASAGIEVHLVYLDRGRLRLPLSIRNNSDGKIVEHAIGATWPLHRLLGFYLPHPLIWRLEQLVRAIRPDVIHAHAARPAGYLASRVQGVPLVITEHSGPLANFWRTGHGYRQMLSAYLNVDFRLAVSEPFLREIEDLFPSTSGSWEVLPNGIDTALFRPSEPDIRENDVLYVGSLDSHKDLPTLLRAMTLLDPGTRLTIAGIGPARREIAELARDLGLSKRMTMLGAVSRSRVPELMRSHKVLALPSKGETFSMVCAEALSCGTPVVATRCGGPEYVVPPFGGILVSVGRSDELAAALKRVLDSRDQYPSVRLHAYVEENFSLASVVLRLRQIYDGLAG
jgi:glycosyltransferase involved in cell wall biosynthesis